MSASALRSVYVSLLILCIQLLQTSNGSGFGGTSNFIFGDCEPGKEACQDCYLTLAKSLFGNGANVLNLTNAFFPPNLNPPDSVIVTYHFHNKSRENSLVWFWATSFGYFLHPMHYFQFISLLFGKPRPLYERRVEVTLNAECMGASNQFMQALTQRLEGYIQKQYIDAQVDESRISNAINNVSLYNIIKTYGDDAPNLVTSLSLPSPLIISYFTIILLFLLIGCRCYIYKQQDNKRVRKQCAYTKQKKAAIISSVIIGFIRLFLIVALDSSAAYYTLHLFEVELKRIHHDDNTELAVLYYTPFVLLGNDVFFLVVYITIVVIVCCVKLKFDDKRYYCLLLTLSVPIACILLHLPYIAIAYLNDANHAGSVLILYTVVTFLEFIILQFIFIQWFKLKPVEKKQNSETSGSAQPETSARVQGSPQSTQPETQPPPSRARCSNCHLVSLVIMVISSLLLLYGIIIMFVCFFYYLPINHSISSTSNQIIIIYQTGLVFVGAIVAYKTIFKKRDPFIEALDDCKEEVKNILLKDEGNIDWGASTDQKKLSIFYKHMISYTVLKVTGKIPGVSCRL